MFFSWRTGSFAVLGRGRRLHTLLLLGVPLFHVLGLLLVLLLDLLGSRRIRVLPG